MGQARELKSRCSAHGGGRRCQVAGCGKLAAHTSMGQARELKSRCSAHGGGWQEQEPPSQVQVRGARHWHAKAQRDAAAQSLLRRLERMTPDTRRAWIDYLMQTAGPAEVSWLRSTFGRVMTGGQLSRPALLPSRPPARTHVACTGAISVPSDISAAFGGLAEAAAEVACARAAEAEADDQLGQFLAGRTLGQLEELAQSAASELRAATRAVKRWRARTTLAGEEGPAGTYHGVVNGVHVWRFNE